MLHNKEAERSLSQVTTNYLTAMNSTPPAIPSSTPARNPFHISKMDLVMLHSFEIIDEKLNEIKSELKEVKDQKKFEEKINGFQQSLHTLNQFGIIFKSPEIQKTAEVLKQTLNLTIAVAQITNTMPALLNVAAGIGGVLGPIGAGISAALALREIFSKKKKKQENNFSQVMVSYLQMLCNQLYNLHKTVIDGFKILDNNQRKQLDLMFESVKHLEILIRAEGHQTRIAITDLNRHMDNHIAQLSEQITQSSSELHLQSLKILMNKIDRYIENKETIEPDKVEAAAHELICWVKPGADFTASPLHTGGVNLSSLRNEVYGPITSRILGAESSQQVVMKNIGLLASLLPEFDIPLKYKEQNLDVLSLPYPSIWIKAVLKYIELRSHFPEVLSDKESLIHINNAKKNMSRFIKILQNNGNLYTKLLNGYESALKSIIEILNQATQDKNKEITDKLPNKYARVALDEKISFDISKDFNSQLTRNTERLFYYHINGTNLVSTNGTWSLDPMPFIFFDFKPENTEHYHTILNLLFLHCTNTLPIKFTFGITHTNIGGAAELDLSFEFVGENEVILKKLSDLGINITLTNSNKKFLNWKYSVKHEIIPDRSISLIEWYLCHLHPLHVPRLEDIIAPHASDNYRPSLFMVGAAYLNKKSLHPNPCELTAEFKQMATALPAAVDNYVLKEKKSVINDVLGATQGRAKEKYQAPLKKAYEKLDFYLALLKAYTALAGLVSLADQRVVGSILPDSINDLPNSSNIEAELTNFFNTITLSKEWPLQHLVSRVKIARDDITAAIRSKDLPLVSAPVVESKGEFQIIPQTIFLSALKIELKACTAPVRMVLKELEELEKTGHVAETVKFTQDEIRQITEKLAYYKDLYDIYEDWIMNVDKTHKFHAKLSEQQNKALSCLQGIEKTLVDKTFSVRICPKLNELRTAFINMHNYLATCHKSNFKVSLELISEDGPYFQKLCKKYEKYNQPKKIQSKELELKTQPANETISLSSGTSSLNSLSSLSSLSSTIPASTAQSSSASSSYHSSSLTLFSTSAATSTTTSLSSTKSKVSRLT